MKIAVCLKQVPDTETKLRLKADASGIESAGIKWIVNPYDEFAIEEALKQAALCGGQVSAVSVGPARAQEALRTALAMGAHEALLLQTGANEEVELIDTQTRARALASVLKDFDLIFMGRLSIDDNEASVPQQVAEYLACPHGTVVSKFELDAEDRSCRLVREAEGGVHEHLTLKLPAVVAVNKGINTPRYATLPGIMKAKKKPLTINTEAVPQDQEPQNQAGLRYVDYQLPPSRPEVKMLQGTSDEQVQQLVQLLGPTLGS